MRGPLCAVAAALGICLTLLAAWPARTAEVCRWRFEPGETIRYRRTQDRRVITTASGREATERLLRVTDMTVEARTVRDDGAADLALRVDRIRLTKTSPTGKTRYDSADPAVATGEADRLSASLAPMVGLQLFFSMSPWGEIGDVALAPESRERFDDRPEVLRAIGGPVNLGYLMPSLPLPQDGAVPGQSWRRETEFADALVGTRRRHTTYAFEGITQEGGRRVAEIATSTRISLHPRADAPIHMVLEEQHTEGLTRFDLAAGKLVSSRDRQTLKTVTTMAGRQVRQTAHSTVTVEEVPDAAPADP